MSNLFRSIAAKISGSARTRKVRKTTRRAPLNVENLGERVVLSVSPIHAIAVEPPIAHFHPIPIPHGPYVPELQGYSFYLISSSNKPAHTLVITSETYNFWTGSASFTGTWSGDGPNSHAVSGTLVFAPNSTTVTNVIFSWTNGNNGQNSFKGTLSKEIRIGPIIFHTGEYYLTGKVTSPSGGGPGTVSGFGTPPPVIGRL
jgi:hypothetical protein